MPRRTYKIKGSLTGWWKPYSGPKCPNIKCRSQKRGYFGITVPWARYEVLCYECGSLQWMTADSRTVRPPEGWTRTSNGGWVSPEEAAKTRRREMAVAKKAKTAKKGKKGKKAKKASKGEGVRQVVYFSADNLEVFEAAKGYAEEQEQSFASVVMEALKSYLEIE